MGCASVRNVAMRRCVGVNRVEACGASVRREQAGCVAAMLRLVVVLCNIIDLCEYRRWFVVLRNG